MSLHRQGRITIGNGTPFHNDISYEGTDFLSDLFAGRTDVRVNMLYVEFVNGVTPVPTVVADPGEGRDYYQALEESETSDYLRVALFTLPAQSSSDADKFSRNVISYVAVLDDGVGINGMTFSATAGSKVYGVALVASAGTDRTADIVYSRGYTSTGQAKPAGPLTVHYATQFTEAVVE